MDAFVEDFLHLLFIKWGDLELCLDPWLGWVFTDVNTLDPIGNPNSIWKIVSPRLSSLDEALDFPVLDGKSVRERFAECRFFVE